MFTTDKQIATILIFQFFSSLVYAQGDNILVEQYENDNYRSHQQTFNHIPFEIRECGDGFQTKNFQAIMQKNLKHINYFSGKIVSLGIDDHPTTPLIHIRQKNSLPSSEVYKKITQCYNDYPVEPPTYDQIIIHAKDLAKDKSPTTQKILGMLFSFLEKFTITTDTLIQYNVHTNTNEKVESFERFVEKKVLFKPIIEK